VTRRQAKERVLQSTAASLRGDLDNGSGWIFGSDDAPLSRADSDRMVTEVNALADALDARADKLKTTNRKRRPR
jgi:hypothetical protein